MACRTRVNVFNNFNLSFALYFIIIKFFHLFQMSARATAGEEREENDSRFARLKKKT